MVLLEDEQSFKRDDFKKGRSNIKEGNGLLCPLWLNFWFEEFWLSKVLLSKFVKNFVVLYLILRNAVTALSQLNLFLFSYFLYDNANLSGKSGNNLIILCFFIILHVFR